VEPSETLGFGGGNRNDSRPRDSRGWTDTLGRMVSAHQEPFAMDRADAIGRLCAWHHHLDMEPRIREIAATLLPGALGLRHDSYKRE